MALRLNCLAIDSSWDVSSSWITVVVAVVVVRAPVPPSCWWGLRFVGVGPKVRE